MSSQITEGSSSSGRTEQIVDDDVFGSLAIRALADTEQARVEHPKRRPTWAPPIPFQSELVEVLKEVKTVKTLWSGEKISECTYGRLWAKWRIPCPGEMFIQQFDLREGKDAKGFQVLQIDFYSGCWDASGRWENSGHWEVLRPYRSWQDHEVNLLQTRLCELGQKAIARFVDAPDEVMKEGGRVSGICCVCGRTLTDPTSVSLGIGPECRAQK